MVRQAHHERMNKLATNGFPFALILRLSKDRRGKGLRSSHAVWMMPRETPSFFFDSIEKPAQAGASNAI